MLVVDFSAQNKRLIPTGKFTFDPLFLVKVRKHLIIFGPPDSSVGVHLHAKVGVGVATACMSVPLLTGLVLHGLVSSVPRVTHLAIPLNTEPVLAHE